MESESDLIRRIFRKRLSTIGLLVKRIHSNLNQAFFFRLLVPSFSFVFGLGTFLGNNLASLLFNLAALFSLMMPHLAALSRSD